MSLQRCLEVLLSLVLMFGSSLASAGTVYNAAGDFSVASNPNGVWSYGTTGTTLTGPLALLTTVKSGIGLIPDWIGWEGTQPMFGDDFPFVGKNFGTTIGARDDVVLLPGQLVEHPAPDGSYAVVRFTAPTSGEFQLTAVFEGREFQGGGPATDTDVHILLDGVALFNGEVSGFGSDQSFATTLNLNAGDRVDFSVGIGSDGTFLGDTTALDATLAAVPEAHGYVLMISGLGILVPFAWWRRQQKSSTTGRAPAIL